MRRGPGPAVNPATIATPEGVILFNARTMLDVSQSEVARAMGVHNSTYHRLEQGKLHPSLGIKEKISWALGISYDELIREQKVTEEAILIQELRNEIKLLKEENKALHEYIGGFSKEIA